MGNYGIYIFKYQNTVCLFCNDGVLPAMTFISSCGGWYCGAVTVIQHIHG